MPTLSLFFSSQSAKRVLPREAGDRVKQPYRAPDAASFFAPDAPEYVAEMLSEDAIRKSGIWSPRAVAGLVRRCRSGDANSFRENQALVAVLSTQLWQHQFVQSPRLAPSQTLDLDAADVLLLDAVAAL